MEIDRSAIEDRTIWTLTIHGAEVAHLSVWSDNGEISNVWTEPRYQRRGYARALYERAQSDFAGGIFHTIPDHRTPDGEAFALAVGGDTIDSAFAHVDKHCRCSHCGS